MFLESQYETDRRQQPFIPHTDSHYEQQSFDLQKHMRNSQIFQQSQIQYSTIIKHEQMPKAEPAPGYTKQKHSQQTPFTILQKKAYEALKDIFNFYCNTYTHLNPLDKPTFQELKLKYAILNVQSFLLFCKQFSILSTIFQLEKIKILFKKYAKCGKYLEFEHFVNLINILSHQNETQNFIKPLQSHRYTTQQAELIQFFEYLNLFDKSVYQTKFKNVVQPFDSTTKIETNKIPFQYRKLSLPQLHRKALPSRMGKEQRQGKKKQLYISKASNLVNDQKPVIISWDILKQRSLSMNKLNSNKIKKYINSDAEDEIYLNQYKQKKKTIIYDRFSNQGPVQSFKKHKEEIQKRILQIEKMQKDWNQKLMQKDKRKLR